MGTHFRVEPNGRIHWMLAAAVLPFLLLAAFALAELKAAQQDLVSDRLLQGAQSTASALTQRLAASVAYLTVLASSEATQTDDLPAMYAHAQRIMQTLPTAHAIALVAQDNSVVFQTLWPLGTQGLVSHVPDTVQSVFKTGQPAVSGPFKAPLSDRNVTAVNVPVIRSGKVAYCLQMIMLTSTFNELLLAQKLPEDWTLAIVAANGKIVVRSPAAERYIGQLARAEVRSAIDAKTSTVLDGLTLEGHEVKFAVAQLPGWDWSVAIGVPKRLWTGTQRRNVALQLLFAVSLVTIGAIVTIGLRNLFVGANGPEFGRTDISIRGSWPAATALAVAVALTILAAVATQSSLSRLLQLADQRLVMSAQRRQILELRSQFQDLETGQRGFVITGREVFLKPYGTAMEAIPRMMAELKASMAQGRVEGFSWAELEVLAKERQALSAQAIAERREMGEAVLQDSSLFDHGRLVMEKLRLKLGALEGLLSQRVVVQTELLRRERDQSSALQWLSTLATGALIAFSLGFWWRERGRRKRLYDELAANHKQLEARVMARTAELQAASEQIRCFSTESERMVEAERKRLSREVHDQIGQIFAGIKLILSGLRPGSLAQDQQAALVSALDMGVKTARRIAAELRPPLLDDLGLGAALDHFLHSVLEPAGLSFELELPNDHGLSNEQCMQLFRIVQEAISNVIRHASAHHVAVTLAVTPIGWVLQIDDDGVGFDSSAQRVGALGLLGLRERAQMLGGRAGVAGLPAGGTRVTVDIPRSAAT